MQVNLLETLLHAMTNLILGHLRVAPQRKGDVLEDVHRVEQRAFLKRHSKMLAKIVQRFRFETAEILAHHEDVTVVGLHEADHVFQRDAFPLTGSADDHQRLAFRDIDRQIVEHRLAAERLVDVLEGDDCVIAVRIHGYLVAGLLGCWVAGNRATQKPSNQATYKSSLVRKKSVSKIVNDALTTACVVERPTPSAPPAV